MSPVCDSRNAIEAANLAKCMLLPSFKPLRHEMTSAINAGPRAHHAHLLHLLTANNKPNKYPAPWL